MDEYIKKSDLKAELLRRDFYPAIVKSALETMPPADVVPRAMIAEIFGEIEKVIGEQYENYVFDNLDIEGAEQDAIIAFVDAMKRHFADLKRKYTGEE